MENTTLTYLPLYGPNALCNSTDFPLISHSQQIFDLLQNITKLTDKEIIYILSELITILNKSPLNVIALLTAVNSEDKNDSDVICLVIEAIIKISFTSELNELDRNVRELWSKLLKLLITFCVPLKKHYAKVYEKLGEIMASCIHPGDALKNLEVISTSLKLLNEMNKTLQLSKENPSSYFYFMSNSSNLTINIPKPFLWPYKEGITILMWIKVDTHSSTSESSCTLFRIRSSTHGFECYIANHTLKYCTTSGMESNSFDIGEIEPDKWQFLAISHSWKERLNKVKVVIGKKSMIYIVDFQQPLKPMNLIEEVFFENVVCSVSSILICGSAMTSGEIASIEAEFPLGIVNSNNLEKLGRICNEKQMYGWTPLRTIDKTIYNSFDKEEMFGILKGNSGIYIQNSYFDRIHNIVPFFYIASLLDVSSGRNILNSTLALCFSYLNRLYNMSDSSIRFNKEAKCFVHSLGFNLLYYNPLLPDGNTLKYLGEIMCICPSLSKKVLRMFMTTINFWINTEHETLLLFWESIKASIISNMALYDDVVNTKTLIEIMETMNNSLKNAPCCSFHYTETIPYSLGAKYDDMKYLLKAFIAYDLESDDQSIHKIIHSINRMPCPCLFSCLVSLLKEVAEVNLNCLTSLNRIHGISKILEKAKGYPVDVKVNCLSLAAIALNHNSDKDFYENELKNALLNLIDEPLSRKSSTETRTYKEPRKSLRLPTSKQSSDSVCKLKRLGTLEENPVQNELRTSNLVIQFERRKPRRRGYSEMNLLRQRSAIPITHENWELGNDLSDVPEEKRNDQSEEYRDIVFELPSKECKESTDAGSDLVQIPFSIDNNTNKTIADIVNKDADVLYTALLLWIIGLKPEQALIEDSDRPVIVLEGKPSIQNPQVLSLLLSVVKLSNNKELMGRCLNDFIVLAKSNNTNLTYIGNTKGFLDWLIQLEEYRYYDILNDLKESYDTTLLKKVFQLHLILLNESMAQQSGIEFVLNYFVTSAYNISLELSKDKVGFNKREEVAWPCLKYLWSELLRMTKDLGRIALFIEITTYLVISYYLVTKSSISTDIYNNPFLKGCANSFKGFCISGQELICMTLDKLLDICKMSEDFVNVFTFYKICEEHILDINIKLLECKSIKGFPFITKEHGYTNFAIMLLNLGLNNSDPSDIGNWLTKAKKITYHICLVMEYANKIGHEKLAKNEAKNLLLIIAILMNKYNTEIKNKKQVNKALCDILVHILQTAEELNGEVKEFVRKEMYINESTQQKIFLNAKRCADANGDTTLFNPKLLYNTKSNFSKAYDRVSIAALGMLRSEFKKVAEIIIRKQEIQSKGSGSKVTLKMRLSGILNRRNSKRDLYEMLPDTYKEDAILQAVHNKIKIAKWGRKWVKTMKCLKGWQGTWRNHLIFDDPVELAKVPLIFSKHTFVNGARCLMKLRINKTKCLPPGDLPESSIELLKDENYFILLSNVCVEHNKEFDFTTIEGNEDLLYACNYLLIKERDIAQILFEEISPSIRKQLVEPLDCEIYTTLCAKKGKLFIDYKENTRNYYIKFVFNIDDAVKEDDRLMFTFKYRHDYKLVKKWKVLDIKAIYKKYIVDQKSAIEIAYSTGKSVLYNFTSESNRDKFCARLLSIRRTMIECYPRPGKDVIKDLMNDWINWKISNFDYLIALNNLSGRSFNNVSQYPVFPWIIDDMNSESLELSNELIYRNLGENIGMYGDKDRARGFKERYNSEDIAGLGHFNFGSHYSNPGIIFQFMMRVSPFIEAYVKFYSGLDQPDRMFHSIMESWSLSKLDPNDVRELIPEFFSVPDIFVNREGLHYGKREEDKAEVNHVILPYWAKKSPYRFVELQREALESNYVSRELNKWINLVFGYQQQGKEAEKAFNIFPKLSYEAESILSKAEGSQKDSYRMQAYHWGQTPMQLLRKRHKERMLKNPNLSYSILDKKAQVKCAKTVPIERSCTSSHKNVIKIFITEESDRNASFIVVTIDGLCINYIVDLPETESNPSITLPPQLICSSMKRYKNYYYENEIINLSPIIDSHFPIILLKKHDPAYLVQGGYLNGSILFTELSEEPKSFFFNIYSDTVTCLEINKDESIAISGSASGEVTIFAVFKDMKWTAKKLLCPHEGPVTNICISSEMMLFCTSGKDGIVNLYSYSGSLMRKFMLPVYSPVKYVSSFELSLGCFNSEPSSLSTNIF